MSPTGAFFIGLVAGVLVIWATDALEYLRIDDPIGAVPVHMVCGIWGTLSLGLFATGAYGLPTPTGVDTSVIVKGLFYGGGTAQLMAQAIGSGAVTVATLAVATVLMYAVKATGTLRVSRGGRARRPRPPRARDGRVPGVRHSRLRAESAAQAEGRERRDVTGSSDRTGTMSQRRGKPFLPSAGAGAALLSSDAGSLAAGAGAPPSSGWRAVAMDTPSRFCAY